MGTSMGCMHAFVWGETCARTAPQALMPLACLPVAIAGRNRLWREMAIDAIKADPAWKGGDYTAQPTQGLRAAENLLILAGAVAAGRCRSPCPTREQVDAWIADGAAAAPGRAVDANDLIYQLDASRTYDPSPGLEKITAPMTWVNSADDFINPPELGIAAARRPSALKSGRFVLIPASRTPTATAPTPGRRSGRTTWRTC